MLDSLPLFFVTAANIARDKAPAGSVVIIVGIAGWGEKEKKRKIRGVGPKQRQARKRRGVAESVEWGTWPWLD